MAGLVFFESQEQKALITWAYDTLMVYLVNILQPKMNATRSRDSVIFGNGSGDIPKVGQDFYFELCFYDRENLQCSLAHLLGIS